MGAHTLRHGTEKNRELKDKGEASPSPRNSATSASPKKENGQQGNGEDREINPETRAKLNRMGVKLTPKPIPWERRKWKATPQEIETFRRMGNGQDITEGSQLPKPKPAPQSFVPERLDSKCTTRRRRGKVSAASGGREALAVKGPGEVEHDI